MKHVVQFVIQVKPECEDCPFFHVYDTHFECAANDKDKDGNWNELVNVGTKTSRVPDWCPLRRGNVVVTWEGAVKEEVEDGLGEACTCSRCTVAKSYRI